MFQGQGKGCTPLGQGYNPIYGTIVRPYISNLNVLTSYQYLVVGYSVHSNCLEQNKMCG